MRPKNPIAAPGAQTFNPMKLDWIFILSWMAILAVSFLAWAALAYLFW